MLTDPEDLRGLLRPERLVVATSLFASGYLARREVPMMDALHWTLSPAMRDIGLRVLDSLLNGAATDPPLVWHDREHQEVQEDSWRGGPPEHWHAQRELAVKVAAVHGEQGAAAGAPATTRFVDLVVTWSRGGRTFHVLVEGKIDSGEAELQTEQYRTAYVEASDAASDAYAYVFLTPDGAPARDAHWTARSWRRVEGAILDHLADETTRGQAPLPGVLEFLWGIRSIERAPDESPETRVSRILARLGRLDDCVTRRNDARQYLVDHLTPARPSAPGEDGFRLRGGALLRDSARSTDDFWPYLYSRLPRHRSALGWRPASDGAYLPLEPSDTETLAEYVTRIRHQVAPHAAQDSTSGASSPEVGRLRIPQVRLLSRLTEVREELRTRLLPVLVEGLRDALRNEVTGRWSEGSAWRPSGEGAWRYYYGLAEDVEGYTAGVFLSAVSADARVGDYPALRSARPDVATLFVERAVFRHEGSGAVSYRREYEDLRSEEPVNLRDFDNLDGLVTSVADHVRSGWRARGEVPGWREMADRVSR